MDNCIFCKIVEGEIPAETIFEEVKVLSFLDIAPANKGHALVIPKEHYETLMEIPPEDLGSLFEAVQKVSKAIMKALNADGFNIVMSNKEAAGQEVPHAHIHIIPRFKGGKLNFRWSHEKYEEGEMKKYGEKIRNSL